MFSWKEYFFLSNSKSQIRLKRAVFWLPDTFLFNNFLHRKGRGLTYKTFMS